MVEEEKKTQMSADFETYLVTALNDSLIKKNKIKSLTFESWWIENREKNLISLTFKLDGSPHEIVIKDTKYFVKEIFSADKNQQHQLTCWDLFIGAKVDIFGKATVLKKCDLKTAEWNKFYASVLIEVSSYFDSFEQYLATWCLWFTNTD